MFVAIRKYKTRCSVYHEELSEEYVVVLDTNWLSTIEVTRQSEEFESKIDDN